MEIMHWSHTGAGQWRCALVGVIYQASRVGDRKWMAETIDPAGNPTLLGFYDTLKGCKVRAGMDYVGRMRHEELTELHRGDLAISGR